MAKTNTFKKILAIVLCGVMVLSCIGVNYAYSAEEGNGHVHSEADNGIENGSGDVPQTIASSETDESTDTPVIIITPNSNEETIGNKKEGVYCGAPTVIVLNADKVTVTGPDKSETSKNAEEAFTLDAPVSYSNSNNYTIKAVKGDKTVTKEVQVYCNHLLGGRSDYRMEESCTSKAGTAKLYICRFCGAGYYSFQSSSLLKKDTPDKLHELTVTEIESKCDGLTYKISRCSKCSYVGVETSREKKNTSSHKWVKHVKEATCSEDGISYYECSECNAVYGVVVVNAAGHLLSNIYEYNKDSEGNPDCTLGGTYKAQCSKCGKSFDETKIEPKEEHSGTWKTVKKVTCQEDGLETLTCTRCGHVESKTIPSENVEHSFNEAVEVKSPTCGEQGERKKTCSVCGYTVTEKFGEPSGEHKFEDESVEKNATCGEPGEKILKCTVCGETKTEVIPATGDHRYRKSNRCDVATKCLDCGQTIIEATEHKFGDYYRTNNYHERGLHFRKCEVCGYVERENHFATDDGNCLTALNCEACGYEMRPATSHHLPYLSIPYQGEEDLYHIRVCGYEGCNKIFGEKKAHVFEDDKCTVCGYVRAPHDHNYSTFSDETGHWKACTICGNVIEKEAHDVSAVDGYKGSCLEAVKCSVCGYEVIPAAGSHTYGLEWEHDSEDHYKKCTAKGCEYIDEYEHVMVDDDRDCTTPTKCSICGYVAVEEAKVHSWAVKEGSGTEKGHIRECTNPGCDAEELVEHTAGITANCKEPAECLYCHTKFGNVNPDVHVGGEELRNAKAATEEEEGYTGDYYCLGCNKLLRKGNTIPKLEDRHEHTYNIYVHDGEYHWYVCECGDIDPDGKSKHIFGSYVNNGETHSHTCMLCEYEDSEPHEHSPEDYDCSTAVECVDCNAIIEAAKNHNFAGKAEGTAEGHRFACLNPNCKVYSDLSKHSGGIASCVNPAHCEVCNVEYGTIDPDHHVGGTEIRDHKNATLTEEGYTGDTYCLSCGKKIAEGTVIDKLTETHEHSFPETWSYDNTHHWKQCQCGDWSEKEEHSYKDGICTVCGYSDPLYVPPTEPDEPSDTPDEPSVTPSVTPDEPSVTPSTEPDKPTATPSENPTVKPDEQDKDEQTPPTGDGSGIALCMLLMVMSAAGFAALKFRNRKEHK